MDGIALVGVLDSEVIDAETEYDGICFSQNQEATLMNTTPIKDSLIDGKVQHIKPIEAVIDTEWNEYVAGIAMEKVKEKFEGQAIEVFRLSLQEKNAREISEILGIKEDTVYSSISYNIF